MTITFLNAYFASHTNCSRLGYSDVFHVDLYRLRYLLVVVKNIRTALIFWSATFCWVGHCKSSN